MDFSETGVWLDTSSVESEKSQRQLSRDLVAFLGRKPVSDLEAARDAFGKAPVDVLARLLIEWVEREKKKLLFLEFFEETGTLTLTDRRGHVRWLNLPADTDLDALDSLLEKSMGGNEYFVPVGDMRSILNCRSRLWAQRALTSIFPAPPFVPAPRIEGRRELSNHLQSLERDSIQIIRAAVASAKNPAMLFSMGKDSMVMLRLAEKAFLPGKIPFKLAGIDTRWKFQEMYAFRSWLESRDDIEYDIFVNPEAIEKDVNPFTYGSAKHTDITKTQALRLLLDEGNYDVVFGGARRDEEKSRAKERVFSIRDDLHRWDPKNQRPELWSCFNTHLPQGHSLRVFPLSDWTEADIWDYIEAESIPIVPLYFSAVRPFVVRNGSLIMVDDDRFPLDSGEKVFFAPIRFRTLGCYPLTGGFESDATSVGEIIRELREARLSERSSRVIDSDVGASMEQKKREGYF